MIMTQSTSTDCSGLERKMQHVSSNFNEWLLAKEDIIVESRNEMEDFLDLSLVSIDHDNDELNRRSRKRVSWGDKVEVREYKVIQGDHPCCKLLPLSLDWEHSTTCTKDIDCSRERGSHYRAPRRLSLEDRRQRLFGNVQENLTDFALMDNSLEELMMGLDELLKQATLPDLPILMPGVKSMSVLPPMPTTLDDFEPLPTSRFLAQERDFGVPKTLGAYEEFFSSPERLVVKDAPIVHWRRVAPAC